MKSDILELFSGGNPSVEKSKNFEKKKIFKIFLGRKFSSSPEKSFRMSDLKLKIENQPLFGQKHFP